MDGVGTSTIGSELAAKRARLFVGRTTELDTFDHMLADDSPARVLFLHGPGGIGKSTLLRALEMHAADQGFGVVRFDARDAPTEPAIAGPLLAAAFTGRSGGAAERALLTIDTFETWEAIEGWLRDVYVPSLPAATRVLIAGRRPPGLRWRTDPGWHGGLVHVELRPFSRDECVEYLRRRAVPEDAFARAAQVSRGHPLLLALIADAVETAPPDEPSPMPESERLEEMLAELAEHLAPAALSPEERAALDLVALAHRADERLIEEVLAVDAARAAELCDWLRRLSFVEVDPRGLFPHDVMRLALRASFQRREPKARVRLLDAAVRHHLNRIDDEGVPDPGALLDNFYLFTGFMPRIFTESVLAEEPSYAEAARPGQAPALRALVERQAGARGRSLFDFWWREQPTAVRAVLGAEGEIRGVFVFVELSEPPPAWLEADALAARLWARRDRLSRPWRMGEDVAVFVRAWTHGNHHMGASPVAALWSLEMARTTMTNPKVALAAALHPDTPDWLANGALYGHRELNGSRGRFGAQEVVVTYHDFSEESTKAWFRKTYRRYRDSVPVSDPAAEIDPAVVRAALRNLHRPDRLVGHPLLERVEGRDRAAALRRLFVAECDALRAQPTTEILARVLDRTYLRPAVDQRAAAEACHLSWDQYRRRLTELLKLLAARLSTSLD